MSEEDEGQVSSKGAIFIFMLELLPLSNCLETSFQFFDSYFDANQQYNESYTDNIRVYQAE